MYVSQVGNTNLHGIQRAARTLRVELYTPNFLARVRGRFDALNRGIVAVDEERFPPRWEWISQFERILMVLARKEPDQSNLCIIIISLHCIPRHINTASFDGARRSQGEDGLVVSTIPKGHTVCL